MRALPRPIVRSAVRSSASFALLLGAAAPVIAFGGDRAALRPPAADPAAAAPGAADDDDGEAAGESADTGDDGVDNDDNDDDLSGDPSGAFEGAAADGTAPLADVDAGKRRRRRRGGCPSRMARVGRFCIDRYEAPNRRGARPFVMRSAEDAKEWCAARHERLCTEDEWIAACEGDERRAYPYGGEHVDGRCNDDKPPRPADERLLAKWPAPEAKAHVKALYQATPSGYKRKCASEAGVRDLTGNVEEWVVRTREHDGGWPYVLAGCSWSGCSGGGKPTCRSMNAARQPESRGYETGFRCCRDAKE